MQARHRRHRNHGIAVATAAALAVTGTVLYGTLSGQQAEAAQSGAVKLNVVTANMDFNEPGDAKIWHELASTKTDADVIFLQEVKNTDVKSLVNKDGKKTWRVFQKTTSQATRGSAVVVRNSVLTTGTTKFRDFGLVKAVDANKCRQPKGKPGVGTRYITKVQLKLTNGQWLRVASLHMPPPRCAYGTKSPYAQMTGNVITFVKSNPSRLTVLGADWNRTVNSDPNGIGAKSGLTPKGVGIDGFMYTKSTITASGLKRLTRIDSDHWPVRATLTVPAP